MSATRGIALAGSHPDGGLKPPKCLYGGSKCLSLELEELEGIMK